MPVPDFQALMLPVLRRLGSQAWRTSDLVEMMADEFGLSEAERSELLPSGRQKKIANRALEPGLPHPRRPHHATWAWTL